MTISPDTIAKLWKYQFGPWDNDPISGLPVYFHPYTCGNRNDGNHRDFGGDTGMLIPTIHGWICPCCDYKQPFRDLEAKMANIVSK